nr:hypothetical protein [Tanacetum cinerariifolium]
EISSGSTTTHSDISLSEYDSFIFDFAYEEFADELAHIISPPEYDRFHFWNFPDPGGLMSVLNFGIRENLPSITSVNLPIEDDYSPLLANVVWIFLAYLTYPVIPPYLHPFGNEDTIFDPGITINHFYCLSLVHLIGMELSRNSILTYGGNWVKHQDLKQALPGRHLMLIREISSGSTTTHSDISLSDYEAFYFNDDHIKEISSGSTTTHSDISLSDYDSFIFDLTHEKFVDELAHIISSPEYDRFYFKDLPDLGELMAVLNSGIRENLSTTLVNLPIEDDHSPLLAYVVWIFLAYLTYPVIPPYLHPFGSEDTIFDPGITINHFYSPKPGLSHRHGGFKKFNTHRSHLNEWPMIINGKNTPLLDVLLIPGNLKTLAKGFYPPSLKFLSFNWNH